MTGSFRRLKFHDLFCLSLNAIVGSGIFIFPGALAALAGPSSVLAFPACGLLLLSVALCYAELGGMFKENGASYLYAREAFGPLWGFAVGWLAWVTAILSWATVASALSSQLGYFHPALGSPWAEKAATVSALALFGALNYRGVALGARAVNAFTAAKLIPLAVFVLGGLFFIKGSNYRPFYSGELKFGHAVFLALWALQGFEVTSLPAGESSDPQKDVPRAILGSLLFAAVFYALIQFVAVGVHPGLASSGSRPLAAAATAFLGPAGGTLLALAGLVSMSGFLAGAALGEPRYLSALGADAFTSLGLERTHPRFGTPYRAIFLTTAGASVLALFLDFSKLIDLSNLAVISQYFLSCLALSVLRVRKPHLPRPFRVPAAWLVAPAGCLIALGLAAQASPKQAVIAVPLLGAGFLIKAALKWRR